MKIVLTVSNKQVIYNGEKAIQKKSLIFDIFGTTTSKSYESHKKIGWTKVNWSCQNVNTFKEVMNITNQKQYIRKNKAKQQSKLSKSA